MKRLSGFLKCLSLFLISFCFINFVQAQDAKTGKEKASSIKSLLNAKNFVFKAQSVSPTGGSLRQLTTDYDVRVSSDTVRTFLPYFGRAYSAPIDPADGGIKFTSTSFDYQLTERKKGRFDVLIRPNDNQDVRQMLFSVSKNGYATLQVLSNNRQPITFNGIVTEKR